jgi:hypothetical protein
LSFAKRDNVKLDGDPVGNSQTHFFGNTLEVIKTLCKYLIKSEDENPWAKTASQKETRKPAQTTGLQ